MPPDATIQDLASRIANTNLALEAAQVLMVTQAAGLDALLTAARDEAAVQAGIAAAIADLDAAANDAARAIVTGLTGQVEHVRSLYHAHEGAFADLVAHWGETGDQTQAALSHLQSSIEADTGQIATALTDLGAHYAQSGARLDAAAEALSGQLGSLSSRLTDDWTAALGESFQVGADQVSLTMAQGLQALGETCEAASKAALDAFSTASQAGLSGLSGQLDSALRTLSSTIQEQATSQIASAAQDVLQAAVADLAEAIASSVMASEIGVEVTTAMAPILPYLMAIKAASEAILEAIRIFKTLSDPFGF